MEKVDDNGKTLIKGYHTQEYRGTELNNPIKCKTKNAWLGVGYYFWVDEYYAKLWGVDFKNATGSFDIYQACLDVENCINTVFDEEGYYTFRDCVEKAIEHLRKNHVNPTLEKVHRFLADNMWKDLGVSGIIYDDKPTNSNKYDRIHSEIPDLYYKKRIQIMLFDISTIHKFELYLEEQPC